MFRGQFTDPAVRGLLDASFLRVADDKLAELGAAAERELYAEAARRWAADGSAGFDEAADDYLRFHKEFAGGRPTARADVVRKCRDYLAARDTQAEVTLTVAEVVGLADPNEQTVHWSFGAGGVTPAGREQIEKPVVGKGTLQTVTGKANVAVFAAGTPTVRLQLKPAQSLWFVLDFEKFGVARIGFDSEGNGRNGMSVDFLLDEGQTARRTFDLEQPYDRLSPTRLTDRLSPTRLKVRLLATGLPVRPTLPIPPADVPQGTDP